MEKPIATRSDPEARKAYTRWHYEQNKAAYKKRAVAGRAKAKAQVRGWLLAYLLEHPCIDCGEADPVVLEFDHREGERKLFNIGESIRRSYGLARVQAEVAKCDVRCANCHRRKTYRDAGHSHRCLPTLGS